MFKNPECISIQRIDFNADYIGPLSLKASFKKSFRHIQFPKLMQRGRHLVPSVSRKMLKTEKSDVDAIFDLSKQHTPFISSEAAIYLFRRSNGSRYGSPATVSQVFFRVPFDFEQVRVLYVLNIRATAHSVWRANLFTPTSRHMCPA
jgi:hypothetical protein